MDINIDDNDIMQQRNNNKIIVAMEFKKYNRKYKNR